MNPQFAPLSGSYDPWLVTLSVIIAVSASYTALDLGSRTAAAREGKRRAWLTGGAVAMGFGIWSMHYVGMLAFTLPVPVRYDLPTVLLSLLAAVLASAVALFVVSRDEVTARRAGLGSLFMGAGIVTMHYIGMDAMRLPAMCTYSPPLVALSCVIAIAGSLAALWLTFRLRAPGRAALVLKLLSAMAMGAAIAAMHYTGMEAATFYPSRLPVGYAHAVSVSALGTAGIVVVTFLVLGFAVATSILDQRLSTQRQLSEELYRSQQMLQSILDNIPQRVFWKDLNGLYMGCNRAFASDAGLASSDDLAGRTDEQLPGFQQKPPFSADLQLAIEKGKAVVNCEYSLTDTSGEQRWLRATCVPLRDSSGHICGALGAYEDITASKRAEDAIRRSNAALSDFAHVVSHDLQSPLRVVNNYSQLIAQRYGPQLDDRAQSLLKIIENSIANMDELIRSLLQYATATEPEPEGQRPVALNELLQKVLLNLQVTIAESGAELTSDRLPEVVGYPAQLGQVLQNLISNAIKYRKDGVPPRIHIGANERPEEWVICVRDNGAGIAPENRARIFTPLKRLHGPEVPGFGIGLATCRRVVEHHGGRIWVESQPGAGSTFYFTIPKSEGAKEALKALSHQLSALT
ncbi:MAG TPA: MHYT domain-containing protein [Bryobacteraceae bacterium]|jgi:PAS domain S-box-containing protein|nr:MHYT domain-containing protein [Bryobacteraceae bacterium]